MTITVMATGNHYWLDAVGGWLIVAAAFAVARLLPRRSPLHWRRAARQPVPQPVRTNEHIAV